MFFILCDSDRVSGLCSFSHSIQLLLSAFFRAFALFLLLSQLFGFDGGNAFFLGNSFNRRVVVADEIEMNINVLLAVDRSTACGFVNLNPVNERIEHGVGQLLAVPVFLDQSDKTGCVHLLDFVLLNQIFQLCNTLFQQNLFFIVLLNHALCLSLRQQAAQGTLIELVDFLVQLSHSLLCFGKFLIAVVCCSGLLLIPNDFELLNKLVLVFKDIFAYCLNCL